MNGWRERLRQAVARSGEKHSVIALDAGIAPETLSRILNNAHARPGFETIVRIVHASGESVGWLIDERGYQLSSEQVRRLREVAMMIDEVTKPR